MSSHEAHKAKPASNAVYSSGPIGGLVAEDVIGMVMLQHTGRYETKLPADVTPSRMSRVSGRREKLNPSMPASRRNRPLKGP